MSVVITPDFAGQVENKPMEETPKATTQAKPKKSTKK